MFLKNILRKNDRYRIATSVFKTFSEIGHYPFVVEEKSTKNRRRNRRGALMSGQSDNSSKLILYIPIRIDQKAFLNNQYNVYADILENEFTPENFKIVSFKPMSLFTNPRIENRLLKDSGAGRFFSQKENIQKILKQDKDNFERMRLGLRIDMNAQKNLKEDSINKARENKIPANTNKINSYIPDIDMSGKKDLNSDIKISSKKTSNKQNLINISKLGVENYSKNLKSKFAINNLAIKKTYKFDIKSLIKKKIINDFNKKDIENSSIKLRTGKIKTTDLKIFGIEKYRTIISANSTEEIEKYASKSRMSFPAGVSTREKKTSKRREATSSFSERVNILYLDGKDPSDSFIGSKQTISISDYKKSKFKGEDQRSVGFNKSGRKGKILQDIALGNSDLKNVLKNVSEEIELRKSIFPPQDIKIGVNNLGGRQGSEGVIHSTEKNKGRKSNPKIAIEKQRIATKVIGYVKIPYTEALSMSGITLGEKVLEINFRLTNSKGLNIYSKKEKIDMDKVSFEYYLDYLVPITANAHKIKNRRERSINTASFLKVSIDNNNSFPIATKIYSKHPSETVNIEDTMFSLAKNKNIQSKKTESITQRIPSGELGNKPTLFRITYTPTQISGLRKFSGFILSNFTTAQYINNKSKRLNQERVNFIASPRISTEKNVMDIKAEGIPRDARKVTLMRRTLSVKSPRSKFNIVKSIDSTDLINKNESVDISSRSSSFSNDRESKTFEISDRTVKDGESYEYKLVFTDRRGEEKEYPKKFRATFRNRTGRISASPRNIKKDLNSSRVSFNVTGKKVEVNNIEEEVNRIIGDMDEKTAKSFEKEINEIKQTFSNINTYKVEVHNISDGTSKFLGEYREGEKVEISGNIKLGRHMVTINPVEKNTELDLKDISNSLKKVENILNQDTQIESRVAQASLSKIKNNVGKITENSDKFFKSDYLKKGKILTDTYFSEKFGSDQSIVNQTHDIATFEFTKEKSYDFKVKTSSIKFTITRKNRILIRFSINTESEDIDFLIFSCEKEGEDYPVGTAIFNENSTINFLDFTNEDYYGEIKYYVTPVFENGNTGNKTQLGTVRLLEKLMESL